MAVIFAYILVIILGHFALTLGMLITGFPVALCLAWLPEIIRTPIAGILAGICGVIAATTFGYLVFAIIAGGNSFGLGAFLATTIPLAIPIFSDYEHAQRVSKAAQELPEAARSVAAPIARAAWNSVVGYVLGLFFVVVWFFVLRNIAG